MYYRCTTDILQMYYRYTSDVLQTYLRRTTNVLQIYFRCTSDVRQMYYRFTSDALQMYFRYTTDVLQMFYYATDVLHAIKNFINRSCSLYAYAVRSHSHVDQPFQLKQKSVCGSLCDQKQNTYAVSINPTS